MNLLKNLNNKMKNIILSYKKNFKGIILIVVSSLFAATGQLFWKLYYINNFYFLIIGFIFYFIGAVIMIFSFRYGSLSVLHPLLSIGYTFSLLFGNIFLNEPITLIKSIATLFIIFGVIFIVSGD